MCDALRDLGPFVQWKKREKTPKNTENCYLWLKLATLLKVALLHVCFSRFLNYRNGNKSRKASRTIKLKTLLWYAVCFSGGGKPNFSQFGRENSLKN